MSVTIDPGRCDANPGCPAARACPSGAFVWTARSGMLSRGGWSVDESLCTDCGACVRVCPLGAARIAVREA